MEQSEQTQPTGKAVTINDSLKSISCKVVKFCTESQSMDVETLVFFCDMKTTPLTPVICGTRNVVSFAKKTTLGAAFTTAFYHFCKGKLKMRMRCNSSTDKEEKHPDIQNIPLDMTVEEIVGETEGSWEGEEEEDSSDDEESQVPDKQSELLWDQATPECVLKMGEQEKNDRCERSNQNFVEPNTNSEQIPTSCEMSLTSTEDITVKHENISGESEQGENKEKTENTENEQSSHVGIKTEPLDPDEVMNLSVSDSLTTVSEQVLLPGPTVMNSPVRETMNVSNYNTGLTSVENSVASTDVVKCENTSEENEYTGTVLTTENEQVRVKTEIVNHDKDGNFNTSEITNGNFNTSEMTNGNFNTSEMTNGNFNTSESTNNSNSGMSSGSQLSSSGNQHTTASMSLTLFPVNYVKTIKLTPRSTPTHIQNRDPTLSPGVKNGMVVIRTLNTINGVSNSSISFQNVIPTAGATIDSSKTSPLLTNRVPPIVSQAPALSQPGSLGQVASEMSQNNKHGVISKPSAVDMEPDPKQFKQGTSYGQSARTRNPISTPIQVQNKDPILSPADKNRMVVIPSINTTTGFSNSSILSNSVQSTSIQSVISTASATTDSSQMSPFITNRIILPVVNQAPALSQRGCLGQVASELSKSKRGVISKPSEVNKEHASKRFKPETCKSQSPRRSPVQPCAVNKKSATKQLKKEPSKGQSPRRSPVQPCAVNKKSAPKQLQKGTNNGQSPRRSRLRDKMTVPGVGSESGNILEIIDSILDSNSPLLSEAMTERGPRTHEQSYSPSEEETESETETENMNNDQGNPLYSVDHLPDTSSLNQNSVTQNPIFPSLMNPVSIATQQPAVSGHQNAFLNQTQSAIDSTGSSSSKLFNLLTNGNFCNTNPTAVPKATQQQASTATQQQILNSMQNLLHIDKTMSDRNGPPDANPGGTLAPQGNDVTVPVASKNQSNQMQIRKDGDNLYLVLPCCVNVPLTPVVPGQNAVQPQAPASYVPQTPAVPGQNAVQPQAPASYVPQGIGEVRPRVDVLSDTQCPSGVHTSKPKSVPSDKSHSVSPRKRAKYRSNRTPKLSSPSELISYIKSPCSVSSSQSAPLDKRQVVPAGDQDERVSKQITPSPRKKNTDSVSSTIKPGNYAITNSRKSKDLTSHCGKLTRYPIVKLHDFMKSRPKCEKLDEKGDLVSVRRLEGTWDLFMTVKKNGPTSLCVNCTTSSQGSSKSSDGSGGSGKQSDVLMKSTSDMIQRDLQCMYTKEATAAKDNVTECKGCDGRISHQDKTEEVEVTATGEELTTDERVEQPRDSGDVNTAICGDGTNSLNTCLIQDANEVKTSKPSSSEKSGNISEVLETPSDEQLSQNTKKKQSWALKIFQDWHVEERGAEMDMMNVPVPELINTLSRFYRTVRPQKRFVGGKVLKHRGRYRKETLVYIRHIINRHLASLGRNIDIICNSDFASANQIIDGRYEPSVVQLKGAMKPEDLQKFVTYFERAPYSPVILRHYVWYTLVVHFLKKPFEFVLQLKRNSLEFGSDESGEYVKVSHKGQCSLIRGNFSDSPENQINEIYGSKDKEFGVEMMKLLIAKTDPSAEYLFNNIDKTVLDNPKKATFWYKSTRSSKLHVKGYLSGICRGAQTDLNYALPCLRATVLRYKKQCRKRRQIKDVSPLT